MHRAVRTWASTLAVTSVLISLVGTLIVSSDAEAQRGRRGGTRRRGAAAAVAPEEAPQSAAIAPALEEAGIHWGMSPRETFTFFEGRVADRYRLRLSKAPGAIEQDRIRRQQEDEVTRMRQTFIRFRGQATGWDTSFVRDEYTHGNGEAMLVVREEEFHSTSHYFFIGERLWKRYQAFDAAAFGANVTFEQFAQAIQRRFGQGVERSGSLVEGRPPTRWIEWQDGTTRLRAVDQSRFYGFFCLVFEDKAVLAQLPSLRTNTIVRQQRTSLVDSVLRDDSEASSSGGQGGSDANSDIADRITGQIRRRTDAPEPGATASAGAGSSSASAGASGSSGSSGSSGRSGRSGSSGSSSSSSSSSARDDDPFGGLDL